MYRKLMASEISAVVAKIRTKYEEYCTKFFKNKRVKEQFEARYMQALRSGVDISNFLLAEISAIEELVKKEEVKIESNPGIKGSAAADTAPPQKTPDFADKIIEANTKKIEKYPAASIHKDANQEVKKLLGALAQLYDQQIPALHSFLRNTAAHISARDLTTLENNLRQLGYLGNNRVSARLTRYYTLLSQFPRDYRALEREEKDYIIEAAFLLHELADILRTVQKQEAIRDEKSKQEFEKIMEYVEGIITDFRLKDLKRKK